MLGFREYRAQFFEAINRKALKGEGHEENLRIISIPLSILEG